MTNVSESQEPTRVTAEVSQPNSPESKLSESMQEYYSLQQELFKTTLILVGIIFVSVWIVYNLNIALNYLLGAGTGVVYLRMLGKDVERLNEQRPNPKKTRLALFIGLIIVATQWSQLHIVPIFLGFLTFKAAIVWHVLRKLTI